MIDFHDMQRRLSGNDGDLPPFPQLPEPAVHPVHKPIGELTVGLIGSLGAHAPGQAPLGVVNDLSVRTIPRSVPSAELAFSHETPARFWADEDINVAFPRDRLVELAAEGVIGALADVDLSFLGSISLWDGIATQMAPQVKAELDAHGVDLALLIPFCPQCHQATMVLARALEARGMPTLMLTVFEDLTESYRPPRAAHLPDYPVGAPCGRPGDPEHQRATLRAAMAAVPLDGGSRQFVTLDDLRFQADGGQDYLGRTLEQYRQHFDTVLEHAIAHNSSAPLIGREDEFAITCAC